MMHATRASNWKADSKFVSHIALLVRRLLSSGSRRPTTEANVGSPPIRKLVQRIVSRSALSVQDLLLSEKEVGKKSCRIRNAREKLLPHKPEISHCANIAQTSARLKSHIDHPMRKPRRIRLHRECRSHTVQNLNSMWFTTS